MISICRILFLNLFPTQSGDEMENITLKLFEIEPGTQRHTDEHPGSKRTQAAGATRKDPTEAELRKRFAIRPGASARTYEASRAVIVGE
jgi:hypothetical protein